ncbi:MAG: O-methyltransferase [Actinomycetota bacterium]
MSRSTLPLTPELNDYLRRNSSSLDDVAARLVKETAEMGGVAQMQIAAEQGLLLKMLVQVSGARRALEIGTFTGFSAMMIARGGAERVVCLDVNEEWTAVARRYWHEAGLHRVIELRLGPALATLDEMEPDERFDFAFIDADKGSYLDYYHLVLERLEPGSLMAVDNTLWSGRVIDPSDQSEDTQAIRRFNAAVAQDPQVEVVILPIGDGMTLIRKVGG